MGSLTNLAQQSNDIVTNGMENTCYKMFTKAFVTIFHYFILAFVMSNSLEKYFAHLIELSNQDKL